jgi:glycerol-3-phosphate cytidylyltransferase
MRTWEIADLTELKPHLATDPQSVKDVQKDILYTNLMQKAITVDRRTKVIVNGHHRYQAIVDLGYHKIPVWYVDYLEDERITFGPVSLVHDKQRIIEAGQSGQLLPQCAALHLISGEIANFTEPDCYVPLDMLKTRVFTVGVFDLFHIGHVNLLKAAKRLGHYLIVGVQYNVEKYKTARIFYNFEQRIDIIRSLRFVDLAMPYENVDTRIQDVDFDIFAKGPDQCHAGFQRAVQYCAARNKEVVILPRTQNISATALRKGLEELDTLEQRVSPLVA